jgi:hypothetical protein
MVASAILVVNFYANAQKLDERVWESMGMHFDVVKYTELPPSASARGNVRGCLGSVIDDAYIQEASVQLERALAALYAELPSHPSHASLTVTGHATLPFFAYLAMRLQEHGAFAEVRFLHCPFKIGSPVLYTLPAPGVGFMADAIEVDVSVSAGAVKNGRPVGTHFALSFLDYPIVPIERADTLLAIAPKGDRALEITPDNFQQVCCAIERAVCKNREILDAPDIYMSFAAPSSLCLFVGFLFSNVMYGNTTFHGQNVRAGGDAYTYVLTSHRQRVATAASAELDLPTWKLSFDAAIGGTNTREDVCQFAAETCLEFAEAKKAVLFMDVSLNLVQCAGTDSGPPDEDVTILVSADAQMYNMTRGGLSLIIDEIVGKLCKMLNIDTLTSQELRIAKYEQ